MSTDWNIATRILWFDGVLDFAAQAEAFPDSIIIGGPALCLKLAPLTGAPHQPLVFSLVARVGPQRALDFLLNGFAMTAAEALQAGLVDGVMEQAGFTAWKHQVEQFSPVSQELASEMIALQAVTDSVTAEAAERYGFALSFALPDAAEGIRAFLEKRKPNFRSESVTGDR
ncbi:MAG: hypothetical protein K1Y36_17850 [Blastocatellia bacterium]|nr:hypothetical protein [Blastocatellia bacterium]